MAAEPNPDQSVIPVVDGLVIDGFHLKFSGIVHLDPTVPGDLATIEQLKLGRTVRIQVRANVDAGSPKISRDAGGSIRTFVDGRQAKVDQLDSVTVLREPERAKELPLQEDAATLDEAIPPAGWTGTSSTKPPKTQNSVDAAAEKVKRVRRKRDATTAAAARVGATLTPVPDPTEE